MRVVQQPSWQVQMVIQNAVGRPVRGGNFFDREREQRRVWRRVATDNLLLLAPRRVGKTSLLFRLQDSAVEHGFCAVYGSVSDVNDEVGFVKRLFETAGAHPEADRAFRRLADGPLGRLLKRTKEIGAGGVSWVLSDPAAAAWTELGRSLARALAEPSGPRWLFLIDEVPLFVLSLVRADPSGDRARAFLNWFRRLRQGIAGVEHVRWVLAGSIGLDTVAARLGLGDTINDLSLVQLGAFEAEDADAFLAALGRSYRLPLEPAVRAHICERTGWPIPFYLQLVFAKLRDWCGDHDTPASVAAVDAVYEELLQPSNRAYFDYWRQRLAEELGPPFDAQAVALLSASCRDPAGATRATLQQVLADQVGDPRERDDRLRYLLDVLLSDGYLVEAKGRYPFRSTLLRDYWQRRVAP